ncbi:MAG: signal peptide peptidase SppA [Phycisphaerales bacterium]|nr:signal peptide peptidase SppA [Phycisphaerales bacterium]
MIWKSLRGASALLLVVCGIAALPTMAQEAEPARTVVRLKLDGPILEAPNDAASLFAAFMSQSETRTLHEIVATLRRATRDDNVAGLALIIGEPAASLAQVEEINRALRAFRAAGKPVFAYLDAANNLTYALAAQADHITLAEYSDVSITGLYAELTFFKGLLDKIGVEAQMLHEGAYKGAAEPFTRTTPSPELAENINWLLDGLFERWLAMIAEGRGLSSAEVQALVDQAPLTAEKALAAKLVDEVSTFAAYRQRIQKEFGANVKIVKRYGESALPKLDTSNFFGMMNFFSSLGRSTGITKREGGIGLIYVDGAIMMGDTEEGLFGDTTAGSSSLRALLTQALEDESVRAVVLRVNSPGGSAVASDIIWNAARRLAAEKPLIVSMGGVAASGGYYVSVPGDTVYAEGTTITGSIGVVGGKLILRGLFEDKLGITSTSFGRGKHAGLLSPSQPWTESEKDWMQSYMGEVYTQFKGRITASRGPRLKKDLDDIAGGRVYTGQQALELGLIDELGGLSDALDAAAARAGLAAEYKVYPLPKPSELGALLRALGDLTGKDGRDNYEIALQVLAPGRALDSLGGLLALLREVAPQQTDQLLLGLRQLSVLQRERVGLFTQIPNVR